MDLIHNVIKDSPVLQHSSGKVNSLKRLIEGQ